MQKVLEEKAGGQLDTNIEKLMEDETLRHQEEVQKWMQKAEKTAQLLLDENEGCNECSHFDSLAHATELSGLEEQIRVKNFALEQKEAQIRELQNQLKAANKTDEPRELSSPTPKVRS